MSRRRKDSPSTQPRRAICSLHSEAQSPWIRVSSRSKIARAISTVLSSTSARSSGYLTQGCRIDGKCQALTIGMQIGRRAVQHIHHQFHPPSFDPIANHVAQQAVAAHLRVEFAVQAQLDGLRADRDAVGDRPLQQFAGAVGVQQVVVADEACGEHVDGRGVEGFGIATLYDLSLIHQEDTVRHGQGFFLIVRDEDRGQAEFALDLTDLFTQVLANPRIERRQRLIQQQQPRSGHQRTSESDTLALATGQLMRVAGGEVIEFYQSQHFGDAFLAVVGVDLLHA
ncbi:hypothetical protein EMIT0180MI3_360025 [Priestia megaterium]